MIGRYLGCLLGLAAGDALGTTLEFRRPGTFEPIDDMVGGGPFGLQPGQWTDDTSMALCLAESLIECKGFEPVDQFGALCPVVEGRGSEQHRRLLRHRGHGQRCSHALPEDRGAILRANRSGYSGQRVHHAVGAGAHVPRQ